MTRRQNKLWRTGSLARNSIYSLSSILRNAIQDKSLLPRFDFQISSACFTLARSHCHQSQNYPNNIKQHLIHSCAFTALGILNVQPGAMETQLGQSWGF